jgi:hypothetical protein
MNLAKCTVLVLGAIFAHALAAKTAIRPLPGASVIQGGVARWEGLAAKDCGIHGKRYAAVDAVCYYPIDLDAAAGRRQVTLWDQDGKRHLGFVQVEEASFGEQAIELPPELLRYVDVSPADAARAARESAAAAKILRGEGGVALLSLPLGKPASPLPEGDDDFGVVRIFNGRHRSLHTGRDYPVTEGSAVKAVADGKVALAADHFYTGNAVYIDHGGGLVSMVFHLKSLAVKTGDAVKRGDTLGAVGSTGRATGPHLHLGVRWLGQRIDPTALLEAPTALPRIGDLQSTTAPKAPPAAKRKVKKHRAPVNDEG